ncbi:MAG: anaerobic glycerol-3-phosphate dehydrogenase subunit C [Anaerolineales bacterium]|nr:anaerobic glycerol-3-phosphate dehydrogenase subunit C [Anaerolineales bacterium]
MTRPGPSADLCLKCNICTAACPVAAATDLFPGPKAVGPQAERYRHPRLATPDASVTWCSGCGTCSRVCPHGVHVAEINIVAKARLVEHAGSPLRDQFISRPHWLGAMAGPLAAVANPLLRQRWARQALGAVLHIHPEAPMPAFQRRSLQRQIGPRRVRTPQEARAARGQAVAYFHGCSAEFYEPSLGLLTLRLLEHLGLQPVVPPQTCCGLPLQSNGLFGAARAQATRNARSLAPFARAGIPILGTSTSCTLALKHDYRAILGLEGSDFDDMAAATYDVFEFLVYIRPDLLRDRPLAPLSARVLYHPPCQLKSHNIGTPAIQVLRQIPGLEIVLSEAECCGVAGTYGLKSEKFPVARRVGEPLLAQIERLRPDLVLTDSETCRWWLAGLSGQRLVHPMEVLAASLGLTDLGLG